MRCDLVVGRLEVARDVLVQPALVRDFGVSTMDSRGTIAVERNSGVVKGKGAFALGNAIVEALGLGIILPSTLDQPEQLKHAATDSNYPRLVPVTVPVVVRAADTVAIGGLTAVRRVRPRSSGVQAGGPHYRRLELVDLHVIELLSPGRGGQSCLHTQEGCDQTTIPFDRLARLKIVCAQPRA